jgi:2-polyprenyl-6-methoxyphenol hydroxylase-like FAD-dependent oxidoreductase
MEKTDIIKNEIIIIGAGPTGLMLANQLTRFGVDYLILDQKSGPTDQSRALVVHARSLEIYQQLGLSDQIVTEGQKNYGMNFYKNGKQAASVTVVNADEDASPFPYLMMYEQSRNEQLLYDNLLTHNRDVSWNTEVISIEKTNTCYNLRVKQGALEQTLECKYLIACDGAKSLVRDFTQMTFNGGSYMNVFYVADCRVEGGFSSEKLSIFLSAHSLNLLFPMIGEKHFRMLGILPTEYYHQPDLPFEDILAKVKADMQMEVDFHDVTWHSTYRLHHKKVEHFSKENIFFVGDAAHVHSPVGGQGMNTGLQDAYNLAWKMAMVVKGQSGPALLETYHEERNPVAENLLKSTDRMFQFMSVDSFWYRFSRLKLIPFFAPLIAGTHSIRKLLFSYISQIQVNYLNSSLAFGKAGQIQAGLRLPYFQFEQNGATTSIYTIVNSYNASFRVLLYNMPKEQFVKLDTELFDLIPLDVTNKNKINVKKVGLPESFVMVLRPDNYISYIATNINLQELKEFINNAYNLINPK